MSSRCTPSRWNPSRSYVRRARVLYSSTSSEILLRPSTSKPYRRTTRIDVLGLNKISLDVLEYNTRALRTYERLGFQREGVHREDIYKDGRFVNVMRMSILARELREGPAA